MTFSDIKKEEGRISGLVSLERRLPNEIRAKVKKSLILVTPLIIIALLFAQGRIFFSPNVVLGVLFLAVAVWSVVTMLDCFYYSHYFSGSRHILPEWGMKKRDRSIPFEVLEITAQTQIGDLTKGFLESRIGGKIMARLDVSQENVRRFLNGDRQRIYPSSVIFNEPVTLVSYSSAVFDADRSFFDFLAGGTAGAADESGADNTAVASASGTANSAISREIFLDAVSWVSNLREREKESFRWWGRDSLGRIRGIGKRWSGRDIRLILQYGAFAEPLDDETVFKNEIDELERALVGGDEQNVLLIADRIDRPMSVISNLYGRICDGFAMPRLEHKRIVILDVGAIDKASAGEGQFENLTIRLFNQAVNAGHLILVIEDFSEFIDAAKKRGIDALEILSPFLSSPGMRLIACVERRTYSGNIERDNRIADSFKRISIADNDPTFVIRALERKAPEIERISNLFFTHPSLRVIAEKAVGDLSDGANQTSAALALFDKLLPRFIAKGLRKVSAQDARNAI